MEDKWPFIFFVKKRGGEGGGGGGGGGGSADKIHRPPWGQLWLEQ